MIKPENYNGTICSRNLVSILWGNGKKKKNFKHKICLKCHCPYFFLSKPKFDTRVQNLDQVHLRETTVILKYCNLEKFIFDNYSGDLRSIAFIQAVGGSRGYILGGQTSGGLGGME